MESRQLGRTGLRVSRLGYGLAGIMQRERRGEDISAAGRVLEAVLESGINFLDSAAAYGSTEQIIGNSIAHRRDEFILATKFGADVGRGRAPFTAELIAASVDRSLRRMKTDHLDVLQLHSPEPHHDLMTLDRDLIVEAMLRAKEAGKTRYLGYSGDNEAAQWAVASGAFDTLQTSFNLVDQHARAGLSRWRRHDVAVGLDVGKLAQEWVGDRQTDRPAGVIRPHEHDAGPLVVGEVIGKRADRLPDAGRGVSAQRLLALYQVGLDILQHELKLGIGIAVRGAHGCD